MALAGAAISTGAFILARASDDARVRAELELRAEWRARDFDRKISIAVDDIEGVATLMASQSGVGVAEFKRYAELIHKPSDPYSALVWAPLVKAQDRDAFVAAARQNVTADYDIMQRGPDGQTVPATGRDEFLPILYAAGFEPRKQSIGVDLITRPDGRRTIDLARDGGEPVATRPTTLLSSLNQAPGLIAFWPVYASGKVPPTIEARRAAFRGTIAASFAFDRVFGAAIAETPEIGEAIDFYIDAGAPEKAPVHVASFDPAAQRFSVGERASLVESGAISLVRDFQVLGWRWTLESHFPPALVAGLRSSSPWEWLALGLVLTGLIMIAAERERSRRAGVEALVSERTAELASTNRVLTQEIRERREAEQKATHSVQQLARSQQQLQAVLDCTVDGVITIDERGTVLTFSKPAERIFGYRADAVIGQNIKMLMPEPYHSAHDEYLAAYIVTGVSKIIGVGRQVSGRRKDGSIFPMDLGVGEIRGSEGQREFVGSVRDMTDRVATEEEVRRSQALLKATFDASPFAIVVRDTDLNILFWSRGAETMFGYTADEVLGKSDPLREGAVLDERFAAQRQRVIAGETVTGIEQERRRKDGTSVEVRRTIAPIHIAGTLIGFVGIMEDVTERNAMERQLVQAQKMEAVGSLTGGMAHDFNNLLGVIVGNLDLLQPMLQANPEAEEIAKDALDAALRGADLTQRLLAFARRQPLQPKSVDLNELVSSTGKLLERVLDANIRLTFQLAPDVWPVVVDPAQLESSLVNLATNARDAMPRGGTLSIVTDNRPLDADYSATHAEVKPGDYAVIEVSDTGTGMPPEVASRIFEPFFTTKEQGKGTGLGLSMVFGFMKQSGGHINVYSEPGVGTTFRLYLPRNESVAADAQTTADAPIPAARGETVLVVEDNEGLRRTVMRQIAELGYRALEAEDAATALGLLQNEKVDLLFTDIIMPGGIDGFELARRVIETWPSVRVVLTSGFPGAKIDGNLGSFARFARLLTKPYRKDELARTLRASLDAAAAENPAGGKR